LALDGPLGDSLAILRSVQAYIDIIEVGTPLIYREGMSAVRQIRQAYPDHTLTADCKIMDAGGEEALIAFEAGSDIVTILGVAPDPTVQHAVSVANQWGKHIMADMMQVPDIGQRGQALLQMGCQCLCVHTAYDLQPTQPLTTSAWQPLRAQWSGASLAVAGGINLHNVGLVLELGPDVIIVGGAITNASNPAEVARALHERLQSA
jgi:3-hexulose-6-phosphate synthase